MKKLILEILIGIPVVIGVYALLDFLYCTFITRSPFVFSFPVCISLIALWVAVELISYFIRRKKQG